jgi:DNA (cytosine-5)-methyltransferase 1
MMAHVDLCSGIGGFALGFEWAGLSKPVLFCDIEPWSRKILRKHWPDVPIATDVKELANDPDGLIPGTDPRRTILTAGYPCQPFSLAGERRGSEDDRHIWPYIFSIVQAKRPAWCVFENVYGHVSMGLDEVLSDLEREAYAVRPFVVPACATDAPHRRDRLWIVARNVADTVSLNRRAVQEPQGRRKENPIKRQFPSNSSSDVADTQSKRLEDDGRRLKLGRECDWRRMLTQSRGQKGGNAWLTEPSVGRVANGIPGRVDRLKGLGNAIVPQVAMRIGQTIKAVIHDA